MQHRGLRYASHTSCHTGTCSDRRQDQLAVCPKHARSAHLATYWSALSGSESFSISAPAATDHSVCTVVEVIKPKKSLRMRETKQTREVRGRRC